MSDKVLDTALDDLIKSKGGKKPRGNIKGSKPRDGASAQKDKRDKFRRDSTDRRQSQVDKMRGVTRTNNNNSNNNYSKKPEPKRSVRNEPTKRGPPPKTFKQKKGTVTITKGFQFEKPTVKPRDIKITVPNSNPRPANPRPVTIRRGSAASRFSNRGTQLALQNTTVRKRLIQSRAPVAKLLSRTPIRKTTVARVRQPTQQQRVRPGALFAAQLKQTLRENTQQPGRRTVLIGRQHRGLRSNLAGNLAGNRTQALRAPRLNNLNNNRAVRNVTRSPQLGYQRQQPVQQSSLSQRFASNGNRNFQNAMAAANATNTRRFVRR